ncbi:hypothetical protein J6590_105661 [Homalodisca vitripennis]|nr:hypothetical protein J6590_105661 [Homalodisca vitripennis]
MTKCLECGCHRRHGSKSSATMARSSSHIVQRRRRGRGGGRVRKTRRSKVTKSDRDPYNPQPKRPRQRRTQPRGCGPGGCVAQITPENHRSFHCQITPDQNSRGE